MNRASRHGNPSHSPSNRNRAPGVDPPALSERRLASLAVLAVLSALPLAALLAVAFPGVALGLGAGVVAVAAMGRLRRRLRRWRGPARLRVPRLDLEVSVARVVDE